jgi:hypothetical protein
VNQHDPHLNERDSDGDVRAPGAGERDLHAGERDPHHVLNQPAEDPDPTEWPDPYDRRPDPRFPASEEETPQRAAPGATSTSEPHPREDPEAADADAPQRERLDR